MLVAASRETSESAKQWVYRVLRRGIMTGQFEPGDPVTINGLAETLGVSAMPVREALHRLVADGALELLDNRRVRVPDLDPQRFEEVMEARVALETRAAERAMPFIDETRLARMRAFDQQADQALAIGNFGRLVEANFDFHRCLYEARPGTVLLPLIESLWLRLGPFMRRAGETLSETYQVDRHAEALCAIVKQDAEALKVAIAADIRDGAGHLGRSHFERIAALEERADGSRDRKTGTFTL
ncbi:MAG TPA: GntR family transcriptional regulator [Shinella sp.]|jgi:DNA-binding GntR family transcriptional regulator|uniref:GntR family transcriptional regulator n=1 Tax=Shinella sp. TaxID=1870904 RepID=UPI0029B24A61|nr:GntR family transcriptional regulator [Shinella sp.]MDX3974620.1 GntR family transcriptional regulator [Shinella sp.]HEV7249578.1 GntR family transcriptional regulator [Shinella sp.]